jgi:hypothetical protein
VTLIITTLWRSDLEWLAHLVGIIGFGLILVSMLYALRKRKWMVRKWRVARWLWLHHWAGFFGAVLALVHSLANIKGLGLALVIVLILVLSSSGVYLIERRLRRPVKEATSRLRALKGERTKLDGDYRSLHSWGRSATPQGIDTYNRLLAKHQEVQNAETHLETVKDSRLSLAWWKHVHNVGTMMLVGVLLVHIWSKLYFAWGGL